MKIFGAYTAVIGCGAARFADALGAHCHDVVLLPPCRTLDARVAPHPDMLLARLGDTLIAAEEYAAQPDAEQALSRIVSQTRCTLSLSAHPLGKRYPDDVGYNILTVGGYVYGLACRLSPHVRAKAAELGLRLHSVRQGYAGCSALVCGTLVLSADPSILFASARDGAEVFPLSPSGVSLDGYSCGFIGGASGFAENTAVFFGDVSLHPSAPALLRELEHRGISVLSLGTEPLADFGGICLLKNRTSGCISGNAVV